MHLRRKAFGLLLDTEIEVPGSLPVNLGSPSSRPDFSIRNGQADLSELYTASEPYQIGPEGLLFKKTGVARYLCRSNKNCIDVDAAPQVNKADIEAYLISTALPAFLWMWNELVLHGGAFVHTGERHAVALLGRSGSGKSTLLLSLVKDGATVVAEDSFCLREQLGGPEISGLPGCLHVREADHVADKDRSLFEVPAAQTRSSAGLNAMVVLQPEGDLKGSELTQLDELAALEALLRHRHRPRVPDLLGRTAQLLPRWAALSKAVPVYSWRFRQADLWGNGQGLARQMLAALHESRGTAS